jgi:hypothetical protein
LPWRVGRGVPGVGIRFEVVAGPVIEVWRVFGCGVAHGMPPMQLVYLPAESASHTARRILVESGYWTAQDCKRARCADQHVCGVWIGNRHLDD